MQRPREERLCHTTRNKTVSQFPCYKILTKHQLREAYLLVPYQECKRPRCNNILINILRGTRFQTVHWHDYCSPSSPILQGTQQTSKLHVMHASCLKAVPDSYLGFLLNKRPLVLAPARRLVTFFRLVFSNYNFFPSINDNRL